MEFKPFSKKQMQALLWWCKNSPYRERDALICDGAVRSGKTLCMGISFVAWAFYRFERQAFALCGKTIGSLKRNLIQPMLPVLQEIGFCCRMKAAEHVLEIQRGGRVNRFYLFGGKDENSATLIQGITLAGVLFDEVALMPRSFVEQALARCSVEGSKFWFNCNPENPMHWFHQEWILKRRERNALYLHFTMQDNPSLTPAMIARYERLYSGAFYTRFVEGKWIAAQGLVYPFMQETGRYCGEEVEPCGQYAVSCDYGTVNPASFGLWGEKDGIWYRLREYYYDSKRDGGMRTDEEHYSALCALVGERKVSCVAVDPSAASFIEVIRRHRRFAVRLAENHVVDGIRKVSTALKEGRIRICEGCKDSIREFSLYRWEDGSQRDAPVKENDHAMDDIRYFVATILDREADDPFLVLATKRGSDKEW